MEILIIEDMVEALKPVLKDPAKAQQILERYWSEKVALVWDLRDVHTAANEREVALTNRQARDILKDLLHHHDKQLGLRWADLTSYIEEAGLGRKLTRQELDRFVHKNLLTIDRQHR